MVSGTNALRALPTVGMLVLLVVIIAPHFYGRTNNGYLIPTEIVLVLLAVPPILSNTYAGVQNVDPAVRDAAFGMGMTGRQVLFRVELPNALPLIFSGLPLGDPAGDRDRHDRGVRHPRRARPVHLRRPGPAGLPADDQRRAARGSRWPCSPTCCSRSSSATPSRRGITGRTGQDRRRPHGPDSRAAVLTEELASESHLTPPPHQTRHRNTQPGENMKNQARRHPPSVATALHDGAQRLRSSSISSIGARAAAAARSPSQMIFGGPPEFKTRPDGIPGPEEELRRRVRQVHRDRRRWPGHRQRAQARPGATPPTCSRPTRRSRPTTSSILEDPKSNFAAQNIVPIVNKAQGHRRCEGGPQRGPGQAHHRRASAGSSARSSTTRRTRATSRPSGSPTTASTPPAPQPMACR